MVEDDRYLDVYVQAANAIKALSKEERYKVMAALCILLGMPVPPPPKPDDPCTDSAPANKEGLP